MEYLESVLPARVRQALWPFLVRRRKTAVLGQKDERLAALLRSSQSMTLQNVAASWDLGRIPVKTLQ
jgi:hypothetical protein